HESARALPWSENSSALLGRNDDFTVAVAAHRRHQAGTLHLLDQARRAVVADAQVALHQRDRWPSGLDDDFHRLVVERVRLAVATLPAPTERRFQVVLGRGQDALDV